ncbi:MAG: toprim domain-containing protein [Halioglobus sp.]
MNIDWPAQVSKGRGQTRTDCPICDRGPRDDAVSVDCVNLRAKCHRCESTFFPDGEKVQRRVSVVDTSEKDRWLVEKTLAESNPIQYGDDSCRYLQSRLGTLLDVLPNAYTHSNLRLYEDGEYTVHPAMVVPFISVTGEVVGIHRTWFTPEGHVRRWKGIKGVSGAAMRLFPANETLCIAEGIETALAVRQINNDPVWATGSNTMLEKFEVPGHVTHLMIAGDNDESGAGQRSAWKLYHKYKNKLNVAVCIPEKTGTDWLDYFQDEQGSTKGHSL